MTPQELEGLRHKTVCTVEEAAAALGIGRTLAYALARTTGEIAGVKVLSVGRKRLCPTRPLLLALGYTDPGEVRRE